MRVSYLFWLQIDQRSSLQNTFSYLLSFADPSPNISLKSMRMLPISGSLSDHFSFKEKNEKSQYNFFSNRIAGFSNPDIRSTHHESIPNSPHPRKNRMGRIDRLPHL